MLINRFTLFSVAQGLGQSIDIGPSKVSGTKHFIEMEKSACSVYCVSSIKG